MMNAYYGPAYSPFDKQGIGVFTGSLNDIKMLMNYGCDYDCGHGLISKA